MINRGSRGRDAVSWPCQFPLVFLVIVKRTKLGGRGYERGGTSNSVETRCCGCVKLSAFVSITETTQTSLRCMPVLGAGDTWVTDALVSFPVLAVT